MPEIAEQIKAETQEAVREVVRHPLAERLTKLGFGVRGLIYGTTGLLAVAVAIGTRRATSDDDSGALGYLASRPFGQLLLAVIALGLASLALWHFGRVIYDPLNQARGRTRTLSRLGFMVKGVSYTVLCLASLRLLLGPQFRALTGAKAADPDQVATSVLATTWGPWVIGLIGVGALIVGLVKVGQAARGDFAKKLEPYHLSPQQTQLACWLGRCGTAARGLVLGLVGLFFVQAGWFVDPRDVKNLDEALHALALRPYGAWALAALALGLMAAGAYSLGEAIWYRVSDARE